PPVMLRQGPAALNEFLTIAELLADATHRLDPVSESPRLDAELLLARAIDTPRSYLIAHPEDTPDAAATQRFNDTIDARAAGKPIAYITGEKEFWSLDLKVTSDTLVPRPETELLVEHAIGYVSRRDAMQVVDLGTGSGAIAIAVARERPLSDVWATDISEAALRVARHNARAHDVANVNFASGSWLDAVRDMTFDVIVSNPPYVRADDPVLEALSFEPRAALVSGPDGLDAIRRIVVDARSAAKPGAVLLIEHGAEQGDAVAGLFSSAGWSEVRGIRDLAGQARVTAGRQP
ncbi:MAG: peptide chain release factor N(5)-glutamine methyltransferase, partial [Pseudomonadota bacterium]